MLAEKFAKAATIIGQWPISAFQYFFPVIHDLRPGSGYLTNLEQRTTALATTSNYSKNLFARFVVFGEHDNVVEQDRFSGDPYPPKIIEGKDHATVCKPIPLTFEEPFDILTEALA